jgi:hypothetical protein
VFTRVQIGHAHLTQRYWLREDLTKCSITAVYLLRLSTASVLQRYDEDPSIFYHQGRNMYKLVIQWLPNTFNLTFCASSPSTLSCRVNHILCG